MNEISGIRAVWLIAFFDLPTDTKKDRKNYRIFRKFLIEQGFLQIQYSVYARYCSSEEKSIPFRNSMRNELPPSGEVRLLSVTDFQYGKMEIFNGKINQNPEKKPEQMLLF